jgi:hypothetical protein
MRIRLKKSFPFFFLLFLFQTGGMHALYNGNPSFPMMPEEGLFFQKEGWLTVKAGYEWDDLFDRKLTVREHKPHLKRTVKDYEGMGNLGVVTLGCNDRVEVYGGAGAMQAEIRYRPHSDIRLKYETGYRFAWMVGGRALLAYWGSTQLGVDAKYFQFDPQIDRLELNGSSINPQGAYYHYREWQVGIGVSHRMKWFIPYAGLKYADVRSKFRHLNAVSWIFPDKHFTMKNKYPMGVFIGCGVSIHSAWHCSWIIFSR